MTPTSTLAIPPCPACGGERVFRRYHMDLPRPHVACFRCMEAVDWDTLAWAPKPAGVA